MTRRKLCVVCMEEPANPDLCTVCHKAWFRQKLAFPFWAARRARAFERRRWKAAFAAEIEVRKWQKRRRAEVVARLRGGK